MQLISKFKKRIYTVLRVIDIYSKDTWVILFKDKNGIKLLMLFRKFQMNRNVTELSRKDINQIEYGLIKAANYVIDQ